MSRIDRKPKEAYRGLFLALQADAKQHPGGISGIAKSMGLNGRTLANCLNPDSDCPPPPFSTILEIITLAQARRTIFSLAQLVGQVPMDFELEDRSPAEVVKLFLGLINTASGAFSTGSVAAMDGRFDGAERKALEPLLLNLMRSCGELLQSVRGGVMNKYFDIVNTALDLQVSRFLRLAATKSKFKYRALAYEFIARGFEDNGGN